MQNCKKVTYYIDFMFKFIEFYIIVSGMIRPSLKSIEQFLNAHINEFKKSKNVLVFIRVALLSTRYQTTKETIPESLKWIGQF